MAIEYRLDRVMKWAARPEWADAMHEMIDAHITSVCDLYDLGPQELAVLIGEAGVMDLWGCAFEDMLARDFDGRNIADDYLKRRGWKESAGARAYIRALRNSRISLYEVSGVKRDEGFFARDLLRGGEPVWVNEKKGSRQAVDGGRLAMRVIELNGRIEATGALLPFSHEASEEAVAAFELMKNTSRKEMRGLLARLVEAMEAEGGLPEDLDGPSLGELKRMLNTFGEEAEDGPIGIDAALVLRASEFTNIWLGHTLDRLVGPPTDFGDDEDDEAGQWVEIDYALAKGVKQAQVVAALSDVPSLRPEGRNFWEWVETGPNGDGEPQGEHEVHHGMIELYGRRLELSFTSPERAQRGCALIEAALGDLIADR